MKIQFPILPKNSSANERVNPTLSLVFEFSTKTRVTAWFESPRKSSGIFASRRKPSVIFGSHRKIFGNNRKIWGNLSKLGLCEDENLTHWTLKKLAGISHRTYTKYFT